jgi:hypothetical protein
MWGMADSTGVVWAMPDSDLPAVLLTNWAQTQALAAQRLALVHEISCRDLARRHGASSLTSWLSGVLRISGADARRMVALAAALNTPCAATATALAAGVVNESQARVITRTVGDLRNHGVEVQEQAEKMLLGDEFNVLEPATLVKAGARILDTVAPELAEEQLARDLANADKIAARDRSLSWTPFHDGTGRERLTGVFGAEAAATIKAAMSALTQPTGKDDTRTATQRAADALQDICRYSLASGDLPQDGGDAATVVVTMNFDDLKAGVGAGMLDNGESLSPEAVRRLACCAGIIPAVLDSHGVPIDMGSKRRVFAGAGRRALVLRDGGCAFPGCDRPPKWTEGHHLCPWCKGGRTDLCNGVLLCGHHHRVIHEGEWLVRIAADGLPEFVPPFWLDPLQTPRRNTFHRRP